VAARCRATILRIAPTMGGEKAVPENIPNYGDSARNSRSIECTVTVMTI